MKDLTVGRALAFIVVLSLALPLVAQEQANPFQIVSDDLSTSFTPNAHLFMAAAPTPKPQAGKSSEGKSGNKWELEFHVGGTFNTDLDGTSTAFPAGTTVTDFFGNNQLLYPTFFFGPGAANFNSVSSANSFPVITPLDPVLQSSVLEREPAFALGMRASRDLHPRVTAEFSMDYNFGELNLTSAAQAAAIASATTWGPAVTPEISIIGGGIGTSNINMRTEGTRQLSYTGALLFNIIPEGKFIPYVAFGGGGVTNIGHPPTIGLTGVANVPGFGPIRDTDVVNVRFDVPNSQGLLLFGGGFKWFFTPKWGLRVDVRDHMIFGEYRTLVSATPSVTDGNATAIFWDDGAGNSVWYSSAQSFNPSSLNATPFDNITTFTADGPHHQIKIDFGVILRW